MSEGLLIELMYLSIETAALMCAPLIVTILVVGIISQVLQTVTQLKDQALSFVPKVFITGIVFAFTIPWYIELMQKYTEIIFSIIEKAAL